MRVVALADAGVLEQLALADLVAVAQEVLPMVLRVVLAVPTRAAAVVALAVVLLVEVPVARELSSSLTL
jgi:hypothetical protein